jgi:UDP-N-acetylglucosamine 2-epimerase
MKIVSVVGARPQFIKSKPLIDELAKERTKHILIHTGQHYDYEMSKIFFDELNLPKPDYNLGVGSHAPGKQIALMIERINRVLMKEGPKAVVVYGDTNSTLAGALAAAKLNIDVAHVEAGLRSFNPEMPEEMNRVLTDRISRLLFCPTQTSVANLAAEGLSEGVHLVGDTMYDALMEFSKVASKISSILKNLKVEPKKYLLATIHRQHNTDVIGNLRNIFKAFCRLDEPIILPLHPRTARAVKEKRVRIPSNVKLIKPVSYLDMIGLEDNARLVLTDSGGIQKECYLLGVPCLTLREETEWVETVSAGWNRLAGCDPGRIVKGVREMSPDGKRLPFYGDGHAAKRIVRLLTKYD